MCRLKNKVSIITGGSTGIGEETARLFAKEGSKVVIADIDDTNGNRVAININENGGEAIFLKLDVTEEKNWIEVIQKVVEYYGKLTVLVNNAGISLAKDVEETSIEDWNRVMSVNATGVYLGIKQAIMAMKNNGESCSIINRSSIDGQVAEAGLFAYCASKGAVTVLTKSAALSCAKKGYKIRVNSVHPGYIHTKLVEKEAEEYGYALNEYLAKMGKLHPIGFIGEPIDIAYIDVFLASDESRWITGSEFVADGGYTAQ